MPRKHFRRLSARLVEKQYLANTALKAMEKLEPEELDVEVENVRLIKKETDEEI
jgi:hypothetical protein